ncbi:MAG TPA: FixH family protein [Fibrobacteria bacterium]|nr:FixH family protein [Fibrobacteria bacterium]
MNQKLPVPLWMMFLGGIAALGVSAGIFLVIISGKNRHVLVRDDYYEAGLRLDEDRAAEAAFDSLGFSLTLDWESGALLVKAVAAVDEDGGTPEHRARLTSHDLVVQLRRPDDRSADRNVPMTLASDSPPLWVADAAPLRRGRWNVRAIFLREGVAALEYGFIHDTR